jgi:hypothetical protein
MNIKFNELTRVEGQNQSTGKMWTAYKISGTKIDDGTEWTSGNIFDNKYSIKVMDKANALQQGDKINVVLKQNGKFWNVEDILPFVAGEGAPAGVEKAGGGVSSKWNGRTGEAYDRSASVYLAFDLMKEGKGDLKKALPYELLGSVIELADDIFEYINKGVNPVSGTDPLDPPKV